MSDAELIAKLWSWLHEHGMFGPNAIVCMATKRLEELTATPMVKPLEWKKFDEYWVAESTLGKFHIEQYVEGKWFIGLWSVGAGAVPLHAFDTPEAAKAAAEQWYRERIESALVKPPSALAAELERRLPILKAELEKLEEAKRVSQAAMRMEFGSKPPFDPVKFLRDRAEALKQVKGVLGCRVWELEIAADAMAEAMKENTSG